MHEAAAIATPSRTNRSAITNGSQLLRGIDGRSATARRYRDLVQSFVESFGGEGVLNQADKAMIGTAAAITVEAEGLQTKIVNGEVIDHEQATRLVNAQGRALKALAALGSRKRKAPRVAEYLAAKAAREAAGA
jgi:hypothetical protein